MPPRFGSQLVIQPQRLRENPFTLNRQLFPYVKDIYNLNGYKIYLLLKFLFVLKCTTLNINKNNVMIYQTFLLIGFENEEIRRVFIYKLPNLYFLY